MSKSDEKRLRCSYYDALAAIGLMKGIAMIDVARDDALICALMEMDLACVHKIVERYDRNALGYPTPEKVADLAAGCGLAPSKPVRAYQPEPKPCVQIHTISGRLVGVLWGVITGVATTFVVSWMTAAPWAEHVATWLMALPADVRSLLFGPNSLSLIARLWT